jgi:hypothetical protein
LGQLRREKERTAEQERRREMALAILDGMENALEGKGAVPADTVRHLLFAVESLLHEVADE